MKKIRIGDIYITRRVLKSSVSLEHEKQLSYMLGTISARPVIVIREPMAWDRFGNVTVIPALTKEDPAFLVSGVDA